MRDLKLLNYKKENTKDRQEGISMISLVVTIIVLLVLSGITISMISGGNGLLNKAGYAKSTTEDAKIEKKIRDATLSSIARDGEVDFDKLNNRLTESFNINELYNKKYMDNYFVKVGNIARLISKEGDIIPVKEVSKSSLTNNMNFEGEEVLAYDNLRIYGNSVQNGTEIKYVGDNLPYGYTQLEYIEGTGLQYIDTSYIPKSSKIEFETEVLFTQLPTVDAGIIGVKSSEDYSMASIGKGNASYLSAYSVSQNGSVESSSYGGQAVENTWYKIKAVFDSNTSIKYIVVNGNKYTEQTYNGDFSANATGAITIFKYKQNGTNTLTDARIKNAKVYENGILKLNLVPCKDSNNVIGMYDKLTNTFFTNTGSGTFIAGPEVSKGEYKIPIKVSGKNLFNYDFYFDNKSEGGGSVTSTNDAYIYHLKPNTNYTVSTNYPQKPVSGGTSTAAVFFAKSGTYSAPYTSSEGVWKGQTRVVTTDSNGYMFIASRNAKATVPSPTLEQFSSGDYWLQLEEGSTATNYKPYINNTTNIYLNEPLRKLDNAVDYIDFRQGKVIRYIKNENGVLTKLNKPIEEEIDIPEIDIANASCITVDTQIMPSKIEIYYYIE